MDPIGGVFWLGYGPCRSLGKTPEHGGGCLHNDRVAACSELFRPSRVLHHRMV